ncbi:hypothetical protein B0H66DRAFT_349056 [Apodospora peruviana]|uniref:Uncharacterized protein n=1 Tax=Apodospora peruviana TaxID=516989 RepID=A0AAE0HWM9_9PEZI|nr:hypothetical protein B0H66DRAFT_349056 [Apodospora peruviana]
MRDGLRAMTATNMDTDSIARPWYHLPFPRNTRFVGRDEILGTLRDKLFVRKSPRVALVGLGGVGKTQMGPRARIVDEGECSRLLCLLGAGAKLGHFRAGLYADRKTARHQTWSQSRCQRGCTAVSELGGGRAMAACRRQCGQYQTRLWES